MPLKDAMQKADADGNGEVTYEELKVVLPNFPEQAFNRLDKDGSGSLATAELPQRAGRQGPRHAGPRPAGDAARGRFR